MTMKMNAVLAAALSVLVVGGAQAAVSAASTGNSSLLFVATDNNQSVQFVADLGLSFSDMLQTSALITAGRSVSWNFSTDTSTADGVTGNAWSAAYSTFKSTQAGDDFRWAVIAGDSVNGGAYAGRGLMATGNVTVAQMTAASTSTPTGTALGNLNNFIAAHANFAGSTMNSANNGAAINNGSLNTQPVGAMGGTFGGGALTWNYLIENGVSSTFQYQQQVVANPVVFQIGQLAGSAADTLNASPVTFTFDLATNELVLAVPEPSTYALMLAGLVGVVALARRRQR